MSTIIPPLDYIPKLPPIGVNIIVQKLNDQIDKLIAELSKALNKLLKLPDGVKCNDPRVQEIKDFLNRIVERMQKIQRELPKIQTTINQVKTIVNTAKTIKATISAAQLINPVTAPVFIATQLMLIQDQTIVNAIESLKQFQTIPSSIMSKIGALVPELLNAIMSLNMICDGDDKIADVKLSSELLGGAGSALSMPSGVSLYKNKKLIGKYSIIQTNRNSEGYWLLRVVEENTYNNAVKDYNVNDIVTLICPSGQPFDAKVINTVDVLTEGVYCLQTVQKQKSICPETFEDVDYNDLVATEFYNELNVSDNDLDFRSDTIEELLRQQQDLLKSLLEAPSKVYQGEGLPNNAIGKVGDYYVDTKTQQTYGPKVSINSWI